MNAFLEETKATFIRIFIIDVLQLELNKYLCQIFLIA